MKQQPYWWDHIKTATASDTELHTELHTEPPSQTDAVIIGAGYTGLCTALVLARAGLSVVVFEAGKIGAGASSRNGGMVGPSFHKLGIAGLKAQYGEHIANDIIRASANLVDNLETFISDEKIDADFKRNGRFRGALQPSHYDAMARQLESLQDACGIEGYMVPPNDLANETGSRRFHGGVVYNMDAALHPAKYLHNLLAVVRAAGVIVLEDTPVEHVDKKPGGFNVITPRVKTETDHVAVCTNGYTGKAFAWLRRRVLPLRSAMIATEPLAPELMARLMPKDRVYGDSRRIVAYYRSSPDGTRILFGSRATGMIDQPDGNARQLRQSMVEIYPDLAGKNLSHVWSGLVAYTFDHAPHIGSFDGLHFAMGYCGSGVARSTYFGHKLGHKILGNKDEGRTAFDDLQFQSKPFYTGKPWFMPMVLNWHRFADKMGW